MIIVPPRTIAAVAASRGTGVDNLLRRSPKAVWQDSLNDGSAASIDIDLGADRDVDTIAIIGSNAAATATWSIASGTAADASYNATARLALTTMPAESDVDDPMLQPAVWPALFRAPAPFTARYLQLGLTQPVGAGALYIGAVVAGLAFEPAWNREWDGGRGIVDTGARERLSDGGLAAVDGVAVPTFSWVFGDLGDSELAQLWAIVRQHRTTVPALVVEDPDAGPGLAERIHYGTFTNIDHYQRRQASKSRWALEFEDWC